MWKPRVLRSRFQTKPGGEAAAFAAAVLARHSLRPEDGAYPPTWLVLRQEEERAEIQQLSEIRLTQLTLRLALQLSEYFSAPAPAAQPSMEAGSLRESLRTCLTALESRERELCREVRLLLAGAAPREGEEKAGRPAAPGVESAALRERLERRLETLERTERRILTNQEGALIPSAPRPAHAPLGRIARPAALWQGAAPPSRAGERARRALYEHKGQLLTILRQAEPGEQQAIWHSVETHSAHTVLRREQWESVESLTAQEKLERLVRESSYREYTRLLRVLEGQLVPPPPVQASPAGETAPADRPVPAAPDLGREPPSAGTAEKGREEHTPPRSSPAAPLVDWLEGALERGPVKRRELLAQLQAAPEGARQVFLELAGESGAFPAARRLEENGEGRAPTQLEKLTLLTRESRRRELEALIRWVREREKPAEEPQQTKAPAAPPPQTQIQTAPPPPWATAPVGERLRQFLLHRGGDYRRELVGILTAAPPGERAALLRGLEEAAGESAPPSAVWAEGGESAAVLRLLERSADPAALLERVHTTRAFRTWEERRVREQTVLERLRAFSQGRGSTWQGESARLTGDLDGEERQILLRHLQGVQALRRPAPERTAPVSPEERGEGALLQALTFQTQKEYKSFRYHLTRYLAGREEPPRPLLEQLTRWSEDRRRWQALELARPALSAPRAEEGRAAGERTEGFQSPAAPAAEGRRADFPTAPPVVLRRLAALPGAVSPAQPVPPREGGAQAAGGTAPGRSAGTEPRIFSLTRLMTAPQGRQPEDGPGAGGAERAPLTLIRPAAAPQEGRPGPEVIQRVFQPGIREILRRSVTERLLPQEIFTTRADRVFQEKFQPVPRAGTAPLPLALVRTLPAPRREERERGVAGRRETPAPAAPLLFSLIRTAPALAGQAAQRAQARGERTPPSSRPFEEAGPALELRRDRGAEIIQQTARQAVERRVELAVERQEPQLRLLRRQSQEQERALEQQKSALHDLKEQMERQQTLVRRAMERTAAPGMEEPAQVRRLARAVMKELEGQLRLERQRRGLS